MKILFITNDISYYGASRSLKTLIEGLQKSYADEIEIHLVIPKRLKSKNDFETVSAWFNVSSSNIKEFCLPFYNNYKGKLNSPYHLLFNIKWKLNANKLFRFLEVNNFDFIHLNSLTLIDVINAKFPMILHVREVIDNINKRIGIQTKLNKLSKIVFIDAATASAFDSFNTPAKIVLNNPFSMQGLKNVQPSSELQHLKDLCKDKVVFSMIGKVHKEKGSEFIVKTFEKLQGNKQILLIKGGGEPQYINYLKSVASSNVLFLEAGPDVENLYIVSDYILRGEDFPCIGRTTFEALYAGIGVVLPGYDDYYAENLSEYTRFSQNVHTYQPRNVLELISKIKTLKPIPKYNRKFLSNTANYIENFIDFARK